MAKVDGEPLVFAVLAVSGRILSARGARPVAASSNPADLQAIQKLDQQDVAVTLSGDLQALAGLFSGDAVLLEPGSATLNRETGDPRRE